MGFATAVNGPQLASIVNSHPSKRSFLRSKSLPLGSVPTLSNPHALQFENDQGPVDVVVIDYDFDTLLSNAPLLDPLSPFPRF